MGKKKSSGGAIGIVLVLAVVAAGGYAYLHFHSGNQTSAPVATSPSKPPAPAQGQNQGQGSVPQTKPTPAPTQPSNAGTTQQPTPESPEPSSNASDVIKFQGYSGSGSLSLAALGLKNELFQVNQLDWTDTNKMLIVDGKMKGTDGVAYLRVRDVNRDIVQPETVLRPQPGAPDWSNIQGQIPLDPSYQGKTLTVELYQKASDGSHTNLLKFQIQPE